MPCQYVETPEEIAAAKKASNAKLIAPYKKKLDEATRLLCFVMKTVDIACSLNFNYLKFVGELEKNKELQSWWKEHQKMDEKRELEEVKKKALEKLNKVLTKEEKNAIGL